MQNIIIYLKTLVPTIFLISTFNKLPAQENFINSLKSPYTVKEIDSVRKLLRTVDDRAFVFFRNNENKIIKLKGKTYVLELLSNIIYENKIKPYVINKDARPDWLYIEADLKQYGRFGRHAFLGRKAKQFRRQNDWSNAVPAYDQFFKEFPEDFNFYGWNMLTWEVFEGTLDKSLLKTALGWAKYTCRHFEKNGSLDDKASAIDTYANLLYKLGHRHKAITAQNMAVSFIKHSLDKELLSDLEKNLRLMKEGQPTWPLPTDQGIIFDNKLSWEALKSKAKAENKYIFLDCFATWCGPCKAMDADVFPRKVVGDALNRGFINVKIQFDQTSADNSYVKSWANDARTIEQQYQITGFPTYLFFSPDGELVQRETGYLNVTSFLELINKAKGSS
ncbi:thioredoxin family protein [Pedobacter paludis]|uniref:Thioredoxin domain-containing protein n=1 Tax=Pedobacter paludis TaxID=2203212 RepID=A0A317F4U5_9SPHI|nr:thioredoxin fold domain-containing protein [Pedobacter paludis]PWS33343.1 hypothetical protein DF947_01580 [Pedobacter paludis]